MPAARDHRHPRIVISRVRLYAAKVNTVCVDTFSKPTKRVLRHPDSLRPTEGLLDAATQLQTLLVARLLAGRSVDGTALGISRHMRGNPLLAQGLDELGYLNLCPPPRWHRSFGSCARSWPWPLPAPPCQSLAGLDIHHQAMAIVHQHMAHVAELGFVPFAFLVFCPKPGSLRVGATRVATFVAPTTSTSILVAKKVGVLSGCPL